MGALEAGWGAVDDDESVRAVQAAVAAGVTFFDTAANYGAGHSERVLGRAVAEVLDAVARGDVEETVGAVAEMVRTAEPGPGPHTITPKIPVVAVTGTNGKTTTSRMIAHIARADGKLVGWSNTDGIYIDGDMVEVHLADAAAPTLIRENDKSPALYVLMPMRV